MFSHSIVAYPLFWLLAGALWAAFGILVEALVKTVFNGIRYATGFDTWINTPDNWFDLSTPEGVVRETAIWSAWPVLLFASLVQIFWLLMISLMNTRKNKTNRYW